MNEPITYVGIDAHKKDLAIAMLSGDEVAPTTWTVPNEPAAVRRLVRKLERATPGPIRACYEAGPCGYALQRRLTTTRVACAVIAPALIPRKPGERIKTDRRAMRGSWPNCGARVSSPRSAPRRRPTKRSATCAAPVTTRERIGNAVGTGWASCSCAAACTTADGTGRRRIGAGSTA